MHDIENMDTDPTAKSDKELWEYFKELKTPFKVVYPSDSNGYAYVKTQDETIEICTSYLNGYMIAVRIVRCLNALKDVPQPEFYIDALKSKIAFAEEEKEKITQELNNALNERDKAEEKLREALREIKDHKYCFNELLQRYHLAHHEERAMVAEYFSIKDHNAAIRKKYQNVPRFIVYICDILFG